MVQGTLCRSLSKNAVPYALAHVELCFGSRHPLAQQRRGTPAGSPLRSGDLSGGESPRVGVEGYEEGRGERASHKASTE